MNTKLRYIDPLTCDHPELYFGSGSYYVICRACQQFWVRIKNQDNEPDRAGRIDLFCTYEPKKDQR